MEQFKLSKWVWTEKDYETMGWHDSIVYGIRLKDNLEFDIDYIFQWNKPEIEGFPFTFWVSPATLIFEKPIEITFELTQAFDETWFEIENIEMNVANKSKLWTVVTRQGDISFKCDCFIQIIRRKPNIEFGQSIGYEERGGFSFGTIPGDKFNEELKPEIVDRRKRDFELYEMARCRFQLRKELETHSMDENRGKLLRRIY